MKTARSLTPPPAPVASTSTATAHVPTAAEVNALMPIVHQVVARLLKKLPPNVLRDDLVAAGTYGLIDALRKSGGDRGPTFEWYARIRVRGAIVDELRAQDWLTRRARNRVTANAKQTDTTARAAVVGFDDLPPEAGANQFADESQESPLEAVEANRERDRLARAVETLPERERKIVTMHYFQGVPFKLIAQELGVSEPRISQLHSRAMGLLKASLAKVDRVAAA
jgi:RNA polymerase sigma factor for flagellar operon FliA